MEHWIKTFYFVIKFCKIKQVSFVVEFFASYIVVKVKENRVMAPGTGLKIFSDMTTNP